MIQKLHQNRHPKPHVSLYAFPSNSTIGRRVREDTFIRDNRQVKLTEYGEKFLQFAKTEWQNWQQFKQQLKDESDELCGEIKLFVL